MGPAGADHEAKVPSGLHHGHKTTAHRAHIHPYWIGAAKSAVSWLMHFSNQIRARHQRNSVREVGGVSDIVWQFVTVKRMT